MATSRPVRIARRPPSPEGTPSPGPGAGPEAVDRTAVARGPFHDNRAGRARGRRMFLLFGTVLLAIWLLFIALALSSPTVGVSQDVAVYVALSLIALFLGAVGWALTLGRAPDGFWERDGDLVIRERFGRRRRLPGPPMLTVKVVQRYGAGFLGPEPAELVELSAPGEGRRTYLVGPEFFPAAPPEA